MLPANARHAHQEMADIPLLDKGAYALLGNDDLFLRLLADGEGPDAIRDYVAWTLRATQALAIKIVNPGGIAAFKYNGRKLDLDETAPLYGVTPRAILTVLADALDRTGRAAPDPCPWLQSRHPRQRRHDGRDHRSLGGPAAST